MVIGIGLAQEGGEVMRRVGVFLVAALVAAAVSAVSSGDGAAAEEGDESSGDGWEDRGRGLREFVEGADVITGPDVVPVVGEDWRDGVVGDAAAPVELGSGWEPGSAVLSAGPGGTAVDGGVVPVAVRSVGGAGVEVAVEVVDRGLAGLLSPFGAAVAFDARTAGEPADVEEKDPEAEVTEEKDPETEVTEEKDPETEGTEAEGVEEKDRETEGTEAEGVEEKDPETEGTEEKDPETEGTEAEGVEPEGVEEKDREAEGVEEKDREAEGTEAEGVEPEGVEEKGTEAEVTEEKDRETEGVEEKGTEAEVTEEKDREVEGAGVGVVGPFELVFGYGDVTLGSGAVEERLGVTLFDGCVVRDREFLDGDGLVFEVGSEVVCGARLEVPVVGRDFVADTLTVLVDPAAIAEARSVHAEGLRLVGRVGDRWAEKGGGSDGDGPALVRGAVVGETVPLVAADLWDAARGGAAGGAGGAGGGGVVGVAGGFGGPVLAGGSGSGGGAVLALSSLVWGMSGDWSAVPLSSLSLADVGLFTGSAETGYRVPVPDSAAGPVPDVQLGYSSGLIDGFNTNSNGQVGPVGTGWSLGLVG